MSEFRTRAYCPLPFQKLQITPDGNAYHCYFQSRPLGNVLKDSFEQIWFGPLAQEIRKADQSMEFHPSCSERGTCPYLFRPPERISIVSPTAVPLPLRIEFDPPADHCNIGGTDPTPDSACIMCARARPDFVSPPDITPELIGRVRFLLPNLKAMTVLGTAEPFWKNLLFDILKQFGFADHRHHIRLSIFTNGIPFTPEIQDRFLEEVPDSHLHFSLDAATPETYRKVRRVDAFPIIVEHLRRYGRVKGPRRLFRISNNINLLNVGEVVRMVELGAEWGVDGMTINPTLQPRGRTDALLDPILPNENNFSIFQRAQDDAQRRADQLGLPLEFHHPLAGRFGTLPDVNVPYPLRRFRQWKRRLGAWRRRMRTPLLRAAEAAGL